MMFKQNYLNELPEDCIKLIYKCVYDMSVKNIKTCPSNKNIQYYYNLQEMMTDDEDEQFHFPYLQVVNCKVSTRLKYIYDEVNSNCYFPKYWVFFNEQRWVERNAHRYFKPQVAHAKRVDAGLANTRKLLTDAHKIRFVRIRSDNLLLIHKNNQYLHRRFRKHFSGHHEATIKDDIIIDFKMYIDKGDIVIVFKRSMDCLAELLWIFNEIAFVATDCELGEFLVSMMEQRDELRERNPDDKGLLDGLEFNLRRISEVVNELALDNFLIDCNITLEGETAILTKQKPVNFIGIGDLDFETDAESEESEEED